MLLERPLRQKKHTPKEIYIANIATTTPSMPAPREWAVRTGDLSPLVLVNHVDEKIVKESRKSSVVVFAAEQKDLLVVRGRADDGGGRTRGRGIASRFTNSKKLGLLKVYDQFGDCY